MTGYRFVVVVAFLGSVLPASAGLTDGLQVLYQFENAGNLGENSTSGNDGWDVAGITQTSGLIGQAAEVALHGRMNVAVADVLALSPGADGAMTVSFWVNTTETRRMSLYSAYDQEDIPSTGAWPNFDGSDFRMNVVADDDQRFEVWESNPFNGKTNLEDVYDLNDGAWHHVAIVLSVSDGSMTYQQFFDGTPADSESWTPTDSIEFQNLRLFRETHTTVDGDSKDYSGLFDDFAVWDRALGSAEIATIYDLGLRGASIPEPEVVITDVSHDPDANTLRIGWKSSDGNLYSLRSVTDPTPPNDSPIDWPIWDSNQDIAATPPINTLTVPLPLDPFRLFVVEEFRAPPLVVFFDDFESGQGDWTAGSDGAGGTAWELGSPTGVGASAANSPANCFGTNLSANYTDDAVTWLRSPGIDLTTAAEATLSYLQFVDLDPGFDFGTVSVLDSSDHSELAVLVATIDGEDVDWTRMTKSLPAAALGKSIEIEFRMKSDELQNYAGWYIDDVEVTVP